MLVSYNWLQTYFKEKLPEPEKLADIITMGVFEIESVEKRTKMSDSVDGLTEDAVLDVKVLPDRAPYCLSHRYIAQEIGALLGYEYIVPEVDEFDVEDTEYVFSVSIEESDELLAERYVTRVIENVTIASSPDWLKNKLEVLGQRSINAIVDLTNYFMMETGQPLHVFDADKVKGNIAIRRARVGETVTTLDNKVIQLDPSIMVIADDEGPLDIAGIKGGKKAELDANTKRVMTTAACFNPVLVRKAVQKTGVRTDASKRFENAITPERAGLAESLLASYIKKFDSSVKVGQVIDMYPNPAPQKSISVTLVDVVDRLGTAIDAKTVEQILVRCGFTVNVSENSAESSNSSSDESVGFLIAIPPYRRDINITEDIVDEIGRIYGYDKVEGVVPKPETERVVLKNYYYHNLIRKSLVDIGFSEVYTYSLTDAGSMEVQNPLTVERSRMRESISHGFSKKFLSNIKNVDILGLKEIRMFEIGKVFSLDYGSNDEKSPSGFCEKHTLAFGIARAKQSKGHDIKTELSAIAHYIVETIGASAVPEMRFVELVGDAQTPCSGLVVEFDVDGLIEVQAESSVDADMGTYCQSAHFTETLSANLVESLTGSENGHKNTDANQIKFKPISQYPFSARDIAVFVPGERHADMDVLNVILGSLSDEQKKLLVRTTLFDVFTKRKEGEPVKTSYAYRLVFQSTERTLTEEEVSGAMKAINDVLSTQVGWEVR